MIDFSILLPDKHLLDYTEIKIMKEVGHGMFGRVWKASWRDMECAVKEISSTQVKIYTFSI